MTALRRRNYSYRGPDSAAVGRHIVDAAWFGAPARVEVGWRVKWSVAAQPDRPIPYEGDFTVYFGPSWDSPHVGRDETAIKVWEGAGHIDVPGLLDRLERLPFWTGVGDRIYDEWATRHVSHDESVNLYTAAAFHGHHWYHGWACFFRGEGHDFLTSRRFLADGSWRIVRREASDLTMVQFHDLEADARTAWEQARVGHSMLGYSNFPIGHVFHEQHPVRTDLTGLYIPEERVYRAWAVTPLSPQQCLDAAYKKWTRRAGDDRIERWQWAFPDEKMAREHVRVCWLNGQECWWSGPRGLVRLDEDYEPPPEEPADWVKRVQDREGY